MNKYTSLLGLVAFSVLCGFDVAFAQEHAAAGSWDSSVAIGAGLAIGLGAFGAATGQGKVVSTALDSIGRNPSAAGKLNTPMILGLVFIEALGILAFVIAFFLQGKVG
ncbi:MAG: ATP synthase F0 subunit C [bacterium]|nr:ATP synthase F0 subunit C [bacterium]